MLRGLFAKRTARLAAERDAADRVKALVRGILDEPDLALTVSEVECLDPSCPGLETVILLLRPGTRTRAVKVPGAMAEVLETTLRSRLATGEPA